MKLWRISKARFASSAFSGEAHRARMPRRQTREELANPLGGVFRPCPLCACSSKGARLFEGRWNFAGVPMVYTSTSLALAAIEFFVHLDPSVAPADLVSVRAAIPDALRREKLAIQDLPAGWRKIDNQVLQKLGADWARSKRSVALQVPSAALDGEWNVLLNPAHPDFSKIEIAPPTPFRYDERMFK